MANHCVCCNNPLSWIDLRSKQQDGSPQDMCGECIEEVDNIDIPEPKSYLFEYEQEGLKEAHNMESY